MYRMLQTAMPPPGLVILSIVAVQLGAAIATHLFPVLGASGTVAVRILFSALFLFLATRTDIAKLIRTFASHWALLTCFGLCIAAMNFFFYQSIARIPLGTAVAIEFVGPLGVAALISRRLSHFAWITLAAMGIVLLTPLSGVELDPLGVIYAALAGVGWALFVVLAAKAGKLVPGNDGLAIGMLIAGISMLPFIVPIAGTLVSSTYILLAGIAVALLSTTLPFTLEFIALKRLSARSYGVLISLEPGVAALVGAIVLKEQLGATGLIAILCVTIAAIGITVSDGKELREK